MSRSYVCQSIWFGVKDNLLYISNNERLADEAGRRYGVFFAEYSWAGEVVKNRFFYGVQCGAVW